MAFANHHQSRVVDIDPLYACYWSEVCNGTHELVNCASWKNDLRGKLGHYFSDNGEYCTFEDNGNGRLTLQSNPRGVTLVNLLIYRQNAGIIDILLVTRLLKVKSKRQPVLALPSSNPFRKNWNPIEVVHRTLRFLTSDDELIQTIQEEQLRRFHFFNASVIYPIEFNQRCTHLLNLTFQSGADYKQIHWVPLGQVLRSIEGLSLRINQNQDQTSDSIALVEDRRLPETLIFRNPKLALWPSTLQQFVLIEQEYGIHRFLTSN